MRSPCPAIAVLCALAPVLAGEARAAVRFGPEFRVNTHEQEAQRRSSLALEDNGDFVVVWDSLLQDGSEQGVFGQRYNSAGVALAAEFQVNTYTANAQGEAALAMDDDGDFIVVWTSQPYGSYSGVFARRFDSAGSPQGVEFQVNAFTPGTQERAAVAMDADGDFVATWQSDNQGPSSTDVFARRFSSTGSVQAAEFQINTYTQGIQDRPSIGMDDDGDFVVSWTSAGQDGSSEGVFARRFGSSGAPQGLEFQVSTYTSSDQEESALAMTGSGDFVVVWQSYYQDSWSYGIFARRFGSGGSPLANEFQVNLATEQAQTEPAIGINDDGRFVVAWSDYYPHEDIVARIFDSAGVPLGSPFATNAQTTDEQLEATVGVDANGRFVVAWTSYSQDYGGGGVFAQRFEPGITLDVDLDGATEPLSDGLLVLRDRFGFTGGTLVNGATGVGCHRCLAPAIESYLDALGLALDIDQDGSLGPLTDGVLVLRYLFGFTGAALTTGAVNENACSRCDAADIEGYLQNLL